MQIFKTLGWRGVGALIAYLVVMLWFATTLRAPPASAGLWSGLWFLYASLFRFFGPGVILAGALTWRSGAKESDRQEMQ